MADQVPDLGLRSQLPDHRRVAAGGVIAGDLFLFEENNVPRAPLDQAECSGSAGQACSDDYHPA
jgi:hypothetical protein